MLRHGFSIIWSNLRRGLAPGLNWLEPVLRRLRPVRRRDWLLGAVGLLAVLLAVAVYVRSGPEDDAPTNRYVGFYCPACGRSYRVSHREFEQLWNKHEFSRSADGQALVFKCRQCGRLTAVRADQRRPTSTPTDASAPAEKTRGSEPPAR